MRIFSFLCSAVTVFALAAPAVAAPGPVAQGGMKPVVPPPIPVHVAHPAHAPWAYTVSAQLPEAPATMAVYTIMPVDADANLALLEDVFGVAGTPTFDADFGGVLHLRDVDQHAYAYDLGSMAYHDLANGFHEYRIHTVDTDTLWNESEALLADLGLFDNPFLQLAPYQTGEMVNQLHDGSGAVVDTWVSAQGATWKMTLDGWPTFGGGSEVSAYFGDNGMPVGLNSGMRTLQPAGEIEVMRADAALHSWLSFAARTGRWNINKVATPNLRGVDIQEVTLGYFLSDNAQADAAVVPVYQIKGVLTFSPDGDQTETADLIWYQPAAPGLVVPDFAIGR